MKKLFILINIIFAGLIISCDDLLDFENDGRITMDEAFDSRVRVQGYLNACYNYRSYPAIDWASYSDEAEASDKTSGSKYTSWYNGVATASTFGTYSPDSYWSSPFQGIRKCNIFIERIKTATNDITEEKKQGMEAQARTLRAFYYLQLIKRYGGVPIISESLTPDHDFSQNKRATFSEVVTFILNDCDMALSVPATKDGFPWEVYANQYGIMTRAVAYAIKSQAVTYAASPLWSDGTYTWDDATEINKEALYECLTHDYELFNHQPSPSDAQNAYALYFISNSNDQRSLDKETILRGAKMSVWRTAGLPTITGMEKAGPSPTQDLVDCYEMAATGESPVTGYSDESRLNPIINATSGYDPEKPYAGRDPRFYASIYYNGAERSPGVDPDTYYNLSFNTASNRRQHLDFTDHGDYYDLTTTGSDPWIWLSALGTSLGSSPNITLEFEYKSQADIVNPQVFFAPPLQEARSFKPGTITAANGWTKHVISLAPAIAAGWGTDPAHYLRFDWGSVAGINFQIRNIKIHIAASGSLNSVETFVGGNEGLSELGNRFTVTGYYIRKFNNHRSDKDNDADGENRLFRLAELYLNFAESACQSDGPDMQITLGPGLSMSARDAVNAVRSRAGMPDFPTGMTVNEFEKKYRNERRIEFAFEGHRFFDVRRWKILGETDSFVTGMRIIKETDGDLTYQRFKFGNRASASDKYLMYPIAEDEVNKMLEISGINWQNPGW